MTNKPAGFWIRLIAYGIDNSFFWIPISLAFYSLSSSSKNVGEFLSSSVNILALGLLPVYLLLIVYRSYFTARFKTTIGKYLAGLQVTNENGHNLTLKQSLFRHLIGYQFSGVGFGYGFYSAARDPHKLAWHDKSIGSKVIIVRNSWPLALVIYLILLGVICWLLFAIINNFASNTLLKTDAMIFFYQLSQMH